jgi:hypothetical protein
VARGNEGREGLECVVCGEGRISDNYSVTN